MANFKGGFAFNNEAAKVEVEQAPDGTLISCVNPVTGESLGGGNYSEVIEGTLAAPFGDYTISDLAASFQTGDISGVISVDGSSLGILDPIRIVLYSTIDPLAIVAESAGISQSAVSKAVQVNWRSDGVNQYRGYMSNTVIDLPGTLPTEVKLYHHPMPE